MNCDIYLFDLHSYLLLTSSGWETFSSLSKRSNLGGGVPEFKIIALYYITTVNAMSQHSTNHVFVLAQKPDVSSLSPPMPEPQQTMWESHSFATFRTSQDDASAELDSLLQWSSVLVVWFQGRGPAVSNQWLRAVHYQGHALQGLST